MYGGVTMAITGVYSNGVIKTDAILSENQQVIIMPVKKTAFASLQKYANPDKVPLEKEGLEDAVAESFVSKKNYY